MTQIINTKFLCKSTTSISSGRSSKLFDTDLVTFEKGKWYDGEYQTWPSKDGYKLNGSWKKYWVVNEQGKKEEIQRAWFKIMFEYDIVNIRDEKINYILKND
jgi:hypothetical protein